MSDESDVRLPPLPLSFLKRLQEVEAFTRTVLADCNYPGTTRLDTRKAEEIMQAALLSVLDIRLDFYETAPGYAWDWSAGIGSHAVASIMACFPSTSYTKEAEDGSLENEGSYQFMGGLVQTGWDHMSERRLAKGSLVPPPRKKKTLPKTDQGEKERRAVLLAEYKGATGITANQRIYEADKSGLHKPQFYEWLNGVLPPESIMTKNFERFLTAQKRPVRRKPKT